MSPISPAGSGKTLVLVLKALRLLRAAQDAGTTCHVLVVVNSNPVRATVRTAFEVIDDLGFLATTRSDPQFLDVETLHGWCIRELGLEDGPRYVLEADPTASKEAQQDILRGVIEEGVTLKYPKMDALLSRDMIAHVQGDRDQLIRNVGWEIAIRIKGRGFRVADQDLYERSTTPSFIGRTENPFDRRFLFYLYRMYEKHFEELGFLDTDDVVLSMANRLVTSLWNRQRRLMGYDYVMVDETHLFNENERRVLPYLTRGTTDYLPLIMTFDEAQSIGGRRSGDLEVLGIKDSERRNLTYVHRSSPDILAVARDLVERSPLVFSEFATSEPVAKMRDAELRLCRKPSVVMCTDDDAVVAMTSRNCGDLRAKGYLRIGVIVFDIHLLDRVTNRLAVLSGPVYLVKQRGEVLAAVPRTGTYVMAPELCGGLEFDAILLVGADDGRVPPPMGDLSPQGYLSVQEEAYKELYTAVTRAKYVLVFICNESRGISSCVMPSIDNGLISYDGK